VKIYQVNPAEKPLVDCAATLKSERCHIGMHLLKEMHHDQFKVNSPDHCRAVVDQFIDRRRSIQR
jgi:hypothetical protein